MTSYVIGRELQEAITRQNLTQVQLAKRSFKGKSTMNEYIHGKPTTVEAIIDIAHALNDSIFNQQVAHLVFDTLPIMETTTFKETPHSLDCIALVETQERVDEKHEAMQTLAKHKAAYTTEDRAVVQSYALNCLDELLIETRLVIEILNTLDLTLKQAVDLREPQWKRKNYR